MNTYLGSYFCYVTLHIGLGTFRPVKVDKIEDHEMHSEYYIMSKEVADKLNEVRQKGNKIIAVGITAINDEIKYLSEIFSIKLIAFFFF